MEGIDIQAIVRQAVQEFVNNEQAKSEPAHKAELREVGFEAGTDVESWKREAQRSLVVAAPKESCWVAAGSDTKGRAKFFGGTGGLRR